MKIIDLDTSVKWQKTDPRNVIDVREKVLNDIKLPGGLILEVGCAEGNFFELLLSAGFCTPEHRYTGVDISGSQIDIATQKFPKANFIYGDILDKSFNNIIKSADVIISFQVLEHVKFDMELLNKVPAGMPVIFSVPDFPYKHPNHGGHVRWFDLHGWADRYKVILDILEVWVINHYIKNRKIFVFQTIKR